MFTEVKRYAQLNCMTYSHNKLMCILSGGKIRHKVSESEVAIAIGSLNSYHL